LIDEAGARVKLRQNHHAGRNHRGAEAHKFIAHRMDTHCEPRVREGSLLSMKEARNARTCAPCGRASPRRILGAWLAARILKMWFRAGPRAHHVDQGRRIAKLLRIEEELHKRVISQDKSIVALARAIAVRALASRARTRRSVRSCSSPDGRRQNGSRANLAQFMFAARSR